MTPDDIKSAVKIGIKEAIGDLSIGEKQHFIDHEFIKALRGYIATTKKGGLLALGTAIIAGVGWAFTHFFQSIQK